RREVIEWSEKLVRIGVIAPFLPLLLAVRERWPNDGRRYLEILKLCEAYAFRVYRLTQYRADAGRSALFRLGHDLSHHNVDFEGAVERLKWEIAYRCNDDEFKARTGKNHQQMKAAYVWSGLRYFLYEYEITLAKSKGGSPEVKWDDLRRGDLRNTIEHILPQSIDNQPSWREAFPSPEIHQQYLHDIGNLTLTKHNPHLQNKPFLSKKGIPGGNDFCYANSPLFVERDLVNWDSWSPQTIEERKEMLLNWARERWGVELNERDAVRIEQSESIETDEDVDPVADKYSDSLEDDDEDSHSPPFSSAV
ncbi:MAG: HNH endonuclease family protein, partial [Candidatus Poribacteria bacterium]|nr:HNH endonuclease family protein [Candidatus Poribacteria bacterium]